VVPVAQIMALNGYGFGPSTASYPGPGRPSSSRLPLMPEHHNGQTALAKILIQLMDADHQQFD
jgi:hypothetical protein